jgi:hypothetical protein
MSVLEWVRSRSGRRKGCPCGLCGDTQPFFISSLFRLTFPLFSSWTLDAEQNAERSDIYDRDSSEERFRDMT